jgi:hypothetical protein
MESSSASAPPAREPVNIEAAGRVAERETNTSDPLMAPEARGEWETNAPYPRETAMSMGSWETNMPERETAAVRRDGEPLTSTAQERRQEETAAEKHQVAAGEPASSPGGKTADPGVPHTVCPEAGPGDQVGRDGCRPDTAKAAQAEPQPTDPETGKGATCPTCGLRRKVIGLLRNGSSERLGSGSRDR